MPRRHARMLLVIPLLLSGCLGSTARFDFEDTISGTVLEGQRGGFRILLPENKDVNVTVDTTGNISVWVLPLEKRDLFLSWKMKRDATDPERSLDREHRGEKFFSFTSASGDAEAPGAAGPAFLALECNRGVWLNGNSTQDASMAMNHSFARLEVDCHYHVTLRHDQQARR